MFFRSVSNFFLKKISTGNFLHLKWRFLHSFFSEAFWTFFFEKQTPLIIFSIQNGEISILNGDFLHFFFFFRSVLIFFFLNINREFSPFKMKKSPFWMEISPFKCCSEAFGTFFENNLNREFSPFKKLKWRNLHSEWRFLHSNVFQKRFELFFWKTNSTDSFLHSEWRNLHSEWGFLHLFFSDVFWIFFWKKNSTESFLRSEWRNLHSEWRFLHSHVSQKCSVFLKNISTEIFLHSSVFFERWFEHFLKHISTYNFLHPEWRFGDFSIHFFQKRFLLKNKLHK